VPIEINKNTKLMFFSLYFINAEYREIKKMQIEISFEESLLI